MFGLSFQEVFIVGIIAILLFGKRLPEMAKTWGKSYREFRKGLAEIQSSFQVNDYSYRSSSYSTSSKITSTSSTSEYDDYDEPTAPKFEPPPREPREAPVSGSSESPPPPA